MMYRDDWDSIYKDLDKFIEDNLEIEPLRFHALLDDQETIERMEFFIREEQSKHGNGEIESFAGVLKKMREALGLSKPEVYQAALLAKMNYSNIEEQGDRPGREKVLALGFVLINANLVKDNPLDMLPEVIMDKLLGLAGGIEYCLKNTSPFDLIIRFCLRGKETEPGRMGNYISELSKVNNLLSYKGFEQLPADFEKLPEEVKKWLKEKGEESNASSDTKVRKN